MVMPAVAAIEHTRVLRVLIIDSNVEDVRRVRELLAATGEFVTHTARTSDEACEMLADGMFDVALVDSGNWTVEGSELAKYLREHRNDVAVVLLTNGDNEREALPALKLGAHDF
ncbi:MAG: response regulator, partial [Tepidiformaceae bacterium]